MSNDKEQFNEWLKKASEGSLPKLEQSSVYAGIATENFLKDPVCALQLGYAILLDKPIVLIADKTMQLPASLVKVAKLIERVDIKSQEDMSRASKAVAEFARSMQ